MLLILIFFAKAKSFEPREIYTAFSVIKTFKLFYTGEYKSSSIKENVYALNEYVRLKDHCLFSTIQRNAVSNGSRYSRMDQVKFVEDSI